MARGVEGGGETGCKGAEKKRRYPVMKLRGEVKIVISRRQVSTIRRYSLAARKKGYAIEKGTNEQTKKAGVGGGGGGRSLAPLKFLPPSPIENAPVHRSVEIKKRQRGYSGPHTSTEQGIRTISRYTVDKPRNRGNAQHVLKFRIAYTESVAHPLL